MRIRYAVLAGLLALLVPFGGIAPAQANVTFSQQVKLVGQKPVSGRYYSTWTNYGPCNPYPHTTEGCYSASRATIGIKLDAYKISESMYSYDYYYLDADIAFSNRSGNIPSTLKFKLWNSGTTLVDKGDNKSIYASRSDCTTINVGLNASLGVISASSNLGSVRMCSDAADFVRTMDGNTAYYKASRAEKITHLTIHRVVKVARGARPTYNLNAYLQNDSCTHKSSYTGQCTSHTDSYKTLSYSVGTTGY